MINQIMRYGVKSLDELGIIESDSVSRSLKFPIIRSKNSEGSIVAIALSDILWINFNIIQ